MLMVGRRLKLPRAGSVWWAVSVCCTFMQGGAHRLAGQLRGRVTEAQGLPPRWQAPRAAPGSQGPGTHSYCPLSEPEERTEGNDGRNAVSYKSKWVTRIVFLLKVVYGSNGSFFFFFLFFIQWNVLTKSLWIWVEGDDHCTHKSFFGLKPVLFPPSPKFRDADCRQAHFSHL